MGSGDGDHRTIDAGRHFLALLANQHTDEDYRGDVVARYAVEPLSDAELAALDPATAAYARLHTGRSPDGRRLLAEMTGRDVPRLDHAIQQSDLAEVKLASAAWREWLAALFHYADPEAGRLTRPEDPDPRNPLDLASADVARREFSLHFPEKQG